MKIDTPKFNEILSIFLKSTNQKEKTISIILEKIIPRLTSKNIFVDFGCGDGKITKYIGKEFQKTIGIEISENLVEEFRRNNTLKNLQVINQGIEEFSLKEEVDLMLFSYVIGYLNRFKDPVKNANYKFDIVKEHLRKLSENGIALIVDSTYNSKNYKDLFEFMEVPIFDNLKMFEQQIKANYEVTEEFFLVNVTCSNLTDLVLCFRLITYNTGRINLATIEKYKEFGSKFKVNEQYVFEYKSKVLLIKSKADE